METEEFVRNSFKVNAVRITEENISEVADWTGSYIQVNRGLYRDDRKFIEVEGTRTHGRIAKTPAFIGDWVTEFDGRFLKYQNEQFRKIFRKNSNKIDVAAIEEVIGQLLIQKSHSHETTKVLTEVALEKILKAVQA